MSRIHISYLAWPELQDALAEAGHNMCVLGPKQAVSEPVSAHPDIYMCKLGASPKSPVFHGNEALLRPGYPAEVMINAVVTEKFMICNVKTVSKELIAAARSLYPDIMMINVAQGYAKCNVVVVDDRSFITEDEGIYNALNGIDGIKVLKIGQGHVDLPGYSRGFIGGASGRIGDGIWFNGDLNRHPDAERIIEFISSCGLKVRSFAGRKLTDIGSIIEEA